MSGPSVGIAFHRTEPPATVADRARQAEALGFDEFWVIEDCFYTSGPTLAAAALASTASITLGIGIMPVLARTAAITAMEIATLAELAPGRFHAGLGHGMQEWMGQMGVRPVSPLTALRETTAAVQALLAGETVSVDGRYVTLDRVALDLPPSIKPPVSAGVRGPKSLAVAGRQADGVILADFVSATYVGWAREQIANPAVRTTVFATAAIGDFDSVPEGLTEHLAEVAAAAPPSLAMALCWPDLAARAQRSSWFQAAAEMSAESWAEITAYGPPELARGYVESLADAGVDSVVFFPDPMDPVADVERIAGVFCG